MSAAMSGTAHAPARHPRAPPSPPPSRRWSPTLVRERLGRAVELVEVTTEGDVSARRWPSSAAPASS